jgi:hypothetical protein
MDKEQMLAALRPHLNYEDYEEAKEEDDYDLGERVVDTWRKLANIVESRWDTIDSSTGGEGDDFVFFTAKDWEAEYGINVITDLDPGDKAKEHLKSFIEIMCPERKPEWGLKHSYDY